jgi:hypothetical protein
MLSPHARADRAGLYELRILSVVDRGGSFLWYDGDNCLGFGLYFHTGPRRVSYVTRGSVAKTPLFLEHLLSAGVNGRDRRFRAQSRLGWEGQTRLFLHKSWTVLKGYSRCLSGFEIRADNGRVLPHVSINWAGNTPTVAPASCLKNWSRCAKGESHFFEP